MRDSHAEGDRWLRQAENDLAFAQQVSEKALKAIAYASGERLVVGHSLVELVDRLRGGVAALASMREAAGILDQYYVPTRYPNGLAGGVPFEAFGERPATEAVLASERFVAAARRELARGS